MSTTRSFDAPGATITYDVHGESDGSTPLLLIGSPMSADGFTTLASHFTDPLVVTYDPRGVGRSPRTDGAGETQASEHSDDLHRLVAELGGGPVDVFASSGGAVNALDWVARYPGDVRSLVAHEPPLAKFLPDREQVLATGEAIRSLYHERGMGPAMAKFIEYTMTQGPIPEDYPSAPAPDPSNFGLPSIDDGVRDDPLLSQNMRTCGGLDLDIEAVRRSAATVMIAAGEQSGQSMAARGAASVAQALGTELVMFPSHHAGFLGGEFGMAGEPEAFAARLREVLPAR